MLQMIATFLPQHGNEKYQPLLHYSAPSTLKHSDKSSHHIVINTDITTLLSFLNYKATDIKALWYPEQCRRGMQTHEVLSYSETVWNALCWTGIHTTTCVCYLNWGTFSVKVWWSKKPPACSRSIGFLPQAWVNTAWRDVITGDLTPGCITCSCICFIQKGAIQIW